MAELKSALEAEASILIATRLTKLLIEAKQLWDCVVLQIPVFQGASSSQLP